MTSKQSDSQRRDARRRAFLARQDLIDAHQGRRDLTPTARLVFGRIGGHRNLDTKQCNPGVGTLAKETGLNERSVFRAIAELEAKGAIAIEHGQGGAKANSNRYTLLPFTPDNLSGVGAAATPDNMSGVPLTMCHPNLKGNSNSGASTKPRVERDRAAGAGSGQGARLPAAPDLQGDPIDELMGEFIGIPLPLEAEGAERLDPGGGEYQHENPETIDVLPPMAARNGAGPAPGAFPDPAGTCPAPAPETALAGRVGPAITIEANPPLAGPEPAAQLDGYPALLQVYRRPWPADGTPKVRAICRAAYAQAVRQGADPGEILAAARIAVAQIDAPRFLDRLDVWLAGGCKPPPEKPKRGSGYRRRGRADAADFAAIVAEYEHREQQWGAA